MLGYAPHISPLPLPRSGAALSTAFYSLNPAPPHPVSFIPVSRDVPACQTSYNTTRYLTRSFIQNDEACQESSDLHLLAGTIFAYSNRCLVPSTRPSEIEAGFRYFLPNSRLAYEWVYFLDIAPKRFLCLVPPDVLEAYYNEHGRPSKSMRDWMDHQVARWESKEADMISQQLLDSLVPVDYKIPAEAQEATVPGTDFVMQDAPTPVPQTSLAKRKRDPYYPSSGQQIWNNSENVQLGPEPKRARLSSPTGASRLIRYPVVFLASTPVSYPIALATTQRPSLANIPLIENSPRYTAGMLSSNLAITTSPLPAGHVNPVPTLAPLNPPIAPVTIPTQQQSTPHLPQIPLKRQARFFIGPRRPAGTVKSEGRGNVLKGWNASRRRAFTDIQGYNAQDLPLVAISEFGDELSRGHTPKSIDPRECPFHTTMEENLTVSIKSQTCRAETKC